MRWRRLLTLGVAGALVGAAAAASQAVAFWRGVIADCRHDIDGPVDAVVVLGGGAGDRVAEGLRLMRVGVAPVLVLTNGRASRAPAARAECDEPRPYEVVCFRRCPVNTRGEARAVGRMALQRGWSSVTVVTSAYHVPRAHLLFSRCFDGTLSYVVSGTTDIRRIGARAIVHEVGGLMYARFLSRSC